MTSFNLNGLFKGLSPNTLTLGFRAPTYELGGNKIQSITGTPYSISFFIFPTCQSVSVLRQEYHRPISVTCKHVNIC